MAYPIGRYNLNFDLCAGFLNLLLLFVFFRRKNRRNFRVHLLLIMVMTMTVAAFGEFTTGYLRNEGCRNVLLLETVTGVAHYFYISVEYLLALYLLELTGRAHGLSQKRFLLISIPEFLFTAAFILPFVRERLFCYDAAGNYARGPLYFLYDLVVIFYSLYGFALMIGYRKVIRRDFGYVLVLYAGFLGSLFLELVNPYLRASIFMQSLFIAGCILLMDNGEEMVDGETGLYSSYALRQDADAMFGNGYSSHVIAVKLQHYEYYSVMLGAETTGKILGEIGRWLQEFAGRRTTVYRVGPGEFVMVLYNSGQEKAGETAEALRERFSHTWQYESMKVPVSAQIWMTQVPEQVKTVGQLMLFAQEGYNDRLPKDRVYLADEMKDEKRRIAVELAVRRALQQKTLEVYYQPIYDTGSGKIHSAEALVRLRDGELGMISPEEFIGIAEQTGLISQIGEFVFEQVCRFLSEKEPQKYGLEFVEVNLSTVQCMDTDLAERLLAIAQRYGVPAGRINLEITESAMIYSEDTMKSVMERLLQEGFRFSLDDFGTGHANYSYVRNFPFQLIKVDKSFLWAQSESEENHVIFENILSLIRGLHRKAVVEGVETKEQRDMLIAHGVEYLQGYFYSRPVPAQQFLDYIRKFNA